MLTSAGPVDFFGLPVLASRPEGIEGRGLGGGSPCVFGCITWSQIPDISATHVSPHEAP